ncbi:MAG TPA: hypothetical protein VN752_05050 [Solirubrobacterales bacterium]|nr:hypothetical protein [Solirubrobacterales bacterium]
MSESTERAQVLGEAGETCRECGAPLAIDQRYCLNCGRRRGEPRVDFRQHLPVGNAANGNGTAPQPEASAPVRPAATPPAPEKPQRDYAPLAAVGGIAVLGVMLLLGVLIGKGGGDSASAPPPQIVRLGEERGSAAGSDEADKAREKATQRAKAQGSSKAAKNAATLTGGKGGGPVEASDEALRELQEQSPEEYQESSAKLPDEIATGGAPPPKDGKAPGGGSKGTAIE